MKKTNIERLQDVAEALDELNERVVYVGGSVAQLYVDDEAAEEARPTMRGTIQERGERNLESLSESQKPEVLES